MSKSAYIIRQSQGTDDSISLGVQREQVPALAESLADETHAIDLGNHTGFSIHTKDRDEERIDAHPEIQQLLEDVEAGEYDYVVAYDDTRIARDDFFAEFKRAVKLGDAEFAFVAEVTQDDLGFSVRRTVETHIKQQEIAKAREAIDRRMADGKWQGGAPFGTHFPDKEDDLQKDDSEWPTLARVFELLDREVPYSEIAAKTGLSKGGISKINARGREFYEQYGNLDVDVSGKVVE